jgi:Domain of unknown function (DUF4407)
MSILSRFFQFLSKTDRRIIIHCTDHSVKTQVTNGVFVLLTGMFAFLSCMYALYTTFKDFRAAIPVAVLYATVIVFIDREIVSATSRHATFVRLMLAIVIGLVVSVPLEIRLFEERIDQELAVDNNEKNRPAREQMEQDERAFDGKITALEDELGRYRQNIVEAGLTKLDETMGAAREDRKRTTIAGQGPAYRAAQSQLELNEQLISVAQTELAKLTQAQSDVRARIKEAYGQRAVRKVEDLLARYEALEKVKASSPSAIYIAWGIRLLIILLETTPALMKLMQRDNEYNFALEALRRVNISRVIGIANDQIDQITRSPRTAPKPTFLEQLHENPLTR